MAPLRPLLSADSKRSFGTTRTGSWPRPGDHTLASAVTDWLAHGLTDRSPATITTCTILATQHIIPDLGARKLRELRAEDIDRWLAAKSRTLSTSTLQRLHSILSRVLKRAMARDQVRRNVAQRCAVPAGQTGRRSKALTFAQAESILRASERSRMHAYIVVSLLTGARTEELRALTWDHVDLNGNPGATPPIPATWPFGDPSALAATPKPADPAGR